MIKQPDIFIKQMLPEWDPSYIQLIIVSVTLYTSVRVSLDPFALTYYKFHHQRVNTRLHVKFHVCFYFFVTWGYCT